LAAHSDLLEQEEPGTGEQKFVKMVSAIGPIINPKRLIRRSFQWNYDIYAILSRWPNEKAFAKPRDSFMFPNLRSARVWPS
jgi:hypothetical protein